MIRKQQYYAWFSITASKCGPSGRHDMRLSLLNLWSFDLNISLPVTRATSPLSLNVLWFSVFKLMVITGRTDGRIMRIINTLAYKNILTCYLQMTVLLISDIDDREINCCWNWGSDALTQRCTSALFVAFLIHSPCFRYTAQTQIKNISTAADTSSLCRFLRDFFLFYHLITLVTADVLVYCWHKYSAE